MKVNNEATWTKKAALAPKWNHMRADLPPFVWILGLHCCYRDFAALRPCLSLSSRCCNKLDIIWVPTLWFSLVIWNARPILCTETWPETKTPWPKVLKHMQNNDILNIWHKPKLLLPRTSSLSVEIQVLTARHVCCLPAFFSESPYILCVAKSPWINHQKLPFITIYTLV